MINSASWANCADNFDKAGAATCLSVTVYVSLCVCVCVLYSGAMKTLKQQPSRNFSGDISTGALKQIIRHAAPATTASSATCPHPWTMYGISQVSDGCWGLSYYACHVICIGRETARRPSNLCNAKHIHQSHELLQIVITWVSEHVCARARMCVSVCECAWVHVINAISIWICITLALAWKSTGGSGKLKAYLNEAIQFSICRRTICLNKCKSGFFN